MPRTPRVVLPDFPHHVIQRGNNRRRLVSSLADRLSMIACLERGLALSECVLHQLTLMTNHVHMIVTPPHADALEVLMHRSSQRYAQSRNRRLLASGRLFEERYHSKPITDDAYLMRCTLYNDANAYADGLSPDPLGHAWSTGPIHAGRAGSRIPRSLWTPTRWYRGLGATPEERAQVYRDLMSAYAPPVEPPTPYRRRIERPDGTSARERKTQWPLKPRSSR